MKALSVRQPWAWAILHAGKNIENRTWKTRFRGEVAIHASGRMHSNTELPKRSKKPQNDDLVCGAIVGVVDIIDVVDESNSKWFEGEYGFVLSNPRPLLKPIPCKGHLGLWEVPANVSKQVRGRLAKRRLR